ncbi:hypothetical protein FZZ93_10440 [Halomonas eurihalina]|uniref:Uncharacterized protein n=1 Tax=Halomonas eurihalina TaxID=42566 RepID=A0A5D9D982_HALER|nr:hypothetical protein [Halomonas eurihalina]MDR5859679.1 hypothetical protein [Halomonas eurihalina]TZG39135.1 hypothetical protein FZZ93_10440 [Halomonas eurihalina]
MKFAIAVISSLLALTAPLGVAQTLDDIEAAEAKVYEAWEKTPLTVRKAILVAEAAQGFGMYKKRSTNTFESGEPILIYAEPVGYAWEKKNGDIYNTNLRMDVNIIFPDPNEVYTKKDIMKKEVSSRSRGRELMLNIKLDFDGLPSGDYVAEIILYDETSDERTSFKQPFTILDT